MVTVMDTRQGGIVSPDKVRQSSSPAEIVPKARGGLPLYVDD